MPFPPRGGALQRSFHLLRYLSQRHQVKVLALNQRSLLGTPSQVKEAGQSLRDLGLAIEIFDIPADRNRLTWTAMVASGLIRGDPFDVGWLRSATFARAVETAFGRDRFDLAHVDTLGLLPAIAVAPAGLPVALNHHNVESQMMRRRAEQEKSFPKRWYLRGEAARLERFERNRCPAVTINLVVSRLDADRLVRIAPGSRVAVVENGVDPDYFRPPPSWSGPADRLVFSGTMGWYPNHDAMMYFIRDIWPLLTGRDPGLRLTIVGKQPRPELERLSRRDPRITLTGTVEDVRPYLQGAGIYVCPMRDGGGTRLKVLDALASGLPLVATTMSVEGLALEPGRHYLAADTAQDFASAVLRLRDSQELRSRLAEEGRQLAEAQYSWTAIGERLERAYGSAIERSRPIATPIPRSSS